MSNGQVGLITPKIQHVQDSWWGDSARMKGSSDRPIHPSPPLTDEQIQRNEDFASHGNARRSGEKRARDIAAAQHPQQATDAQATAALVAQVQRLADVVDSQREVIDAQAAVIADLQQGFGDLQRRVADLSGNAFVGDSE